MVLLRVSTFIGRLIFDFTYRLKGLEVFWAPLFNYTY
nr:MAG TPA: hypothetical protein [Caudoviricetes sp.]